MRITISGRRSGIWMRDWKSFRRCDECGGVREKVRAAALGDAGGHEDGAKGDVKSVGSAGPLCRTCA